jgi:hypothetical protein
VEHYEFRLTTPWACGLVVMDAATGKVIKGGAPIFDRLIGQVLLHVVQEGHYTLEPLAKLDRQRSLLFD